MACLGLSGAVGAAALAAGYRRCWVLVWRELRMNTGADAGRGKDPQDRLLPEWDAALISSFPSLAVSLGAW